MRKARVRFVLALGLMSLSLSACQNQMTNGIDFEDNSYNAFSYKGTDYLITQEKVDDHLLIGSEKAFYHLNWSQQGDEKVGIAYNGLMRTSDDGLAIGIQGDYYLVKEKAKVTSKTSLYEPEIEVVVTIGKSDCRLIHLNTDTYLISDTEVPKEEIGAELAFLNTQKVFEASTGKELQAKELAQIDLDGKHIETRLIWDYGAVYQLSNQPTTYAISINDTYYLLKKLGD